MSTTKAFRGFTPARMKGGGYNNEAVTDTIAWSSTGLAGTPTNNIFTGDPVVLPGANFATISPFIAGTLKPSGIFMGCQYVENENRSSHVIGRVELVLPILSFSSLQMPIKLITFNVH